MANTRFNLISPVVTILARIRKAGAAT